MKKILLFAFLAIGMMANAQNGLHFVDKEYFTFSVLVDPGGSIKEKGLNLSAELELVSKWGYVKATTQVFPALEGGYIDLAGGLGLNLTSGYFDEWRGYAGIRLGTIFRGNYQYPLFGLESGIEIPISSKFYIGAVITYDLRTDMKFSGAREEYQGNGKVKIGTRF